MPASPSRTPSPAPAPPTADAPGPKATRLITIFTQSVDATLAKCSYSSFAACFPTAAKYVPESLDALWRNFTGQLGSVWKAEFEAIMKEREVVKSLNGLDDAVGEARKRMEREGGGGVVPVPPHTLSPETLHLAHLMPFLEEHTAILNTQLAETQTKNKELADEVMGQRKEIETFMRGLESVIRDLETSAQLMRAEEVQGLGAEVREIEAGMKK
ncbi:Nnf1-domain-containing protein [Mytilinidion resinicola]|uniref:Nnf1-domain-containing protein n=1 Tax=Mytilinidion resinicola TaxID=574789 RepID=A0A6A6Z033_9PEZI|nr:Nnf1-domain-containing protein [Mytilinidion resinicola]KAF2814522.1 Nnf1-domain-containing protein [Mytilinidion resinicola]